MRTPYLSENNTSRRWTDYFGGINRRERTNDGAWSEMENLTVDQYPPGKVRDRKGTAGPRSYAGRIVDSARVNGTIFLLDSEDELIPMKEDGSTPFESLIRGAGGQVVANGRNLVFIGGQVLEQATDQTTPEEVSAATHNAYARLDAPVTIMPVSAADEEIQIAHTKPAQPANGDWYMDDETGGLYRYSDSTESWVPQADCYLRLTFDLSGVRGTDYTTDGDIDSLFDGGIRNDCVTVSPSFSGGAGRSALLEIMMMYRRVFEWIGAEMVGANYIVERAEKTDPLTYTMLVRGLYIKQFASLTRMRVTRRHPQMDYIIEHKNRIWGCRYGLNDQGQFVNEIYGSALGDPLNWFRYEGTAADSYTASVGTGEAFTGIAHTEDYVVFFKEDRCYLLSGSEPSNFRLREVCGPGVAAGSYKSLVEVSGALYYLSPIGVMKLTPYNYPSCISDVLGRRDMRDGIGATDGRRYYLRCIDNGAEALYLYDLEKEMWTRDSVDHGEITHLLRYGDSVMEISAQARTEGKVVKAGYDADAAEADADNPLHELIVKLSQKMVCGTDGAAPGPLDQVEIISVPIYKTEVRETSGINATLYVTEWQPDAESAQIFEDFEDPLSWVYYKGQKLKWLRSEQSWVVNFDQDMIPSLVKTGSPCLLISKVQYGGGEGTALMFVSDEDWREATDPSVDLFTTLEKYVWREVKANRDLFASDEDADEFYERAIAYDPTLLYLKDIEIEPYRDAFFTVREGNGETVTIGALTSPFVMEDKVSWYGITGIRGLETPATKRVNAIRIRGKTGDRTALKVWIQYDEDGVWEPILNENRHKKGTFVIKHIPQRRCDIYRLKFEGKGDFVLYSITEDLEDAGDPAIGF